MALVQGQTLPGGWAAQTVSPTRLVLARPAASRWAALRRLGFVLIPLVLAAALLAATWDVDGGLKLALWPVVALLLAVAVLGVLAAVRTVMHSREGARLELETSRRLATGAPLAPPAFWSLAPRVQTVSWDEVHQVLVSAHPGGHSGPGLVGVSISLKGGGRLLGPEQPCHDGELDECTRALTRVADALAERLGVAVQLERH